MKTLLVSVPLELPLAVYSLAANLIHSGASEPDRIRVLNLRADRLATYSQKIGEIWSYLAQVVEWEPDLIAFSAYLWNTISIRELALITRRLFPNVILAVGGPEVATTEAAAQWIEEGGCDIAIRGEGEVTFSELTTALRRCGTAKDIPGCSWRNGSGVVHEPDRPPLRDLAALCSPYLSSLIPDGLVGAGPSARFPRMLVETYRGCYMRCSYCQWGNGSGLRSRFPQDRVLAELDWGLSRRLEKIFVIDAMFGYNLQDAKRTLRFIADSKKRYNTGTEIVCYHNQDFFDEELFSLYREAGISVEIDVQSTAPAVLQALGRSRWDYRSLDAHLSAFGRIGVQTTGAVDLIVGLPQDNLEQFMESLDRALGRGLDVNLYHTSIIPGTPMQRSAESDGVVSSPLPPRSSFHNHTFPLPQMIAARLLGHGADLFRRAPRTAHALTRFLYERPSRLCQAFGQALWQQHGLMYGDTHQYDRVLRGMEDAMKAVVGELTAPLPFRAVLLDLFSAELLQSACAQPHWLEKRPPVLAPGSAGLPEAGWLASRLRFDAHRVMKTRLAYPIQQLLQAWRSVTDVPPQTAWESLKPVNAVAIVYRSAPSVAEIRVVDRGFTYALLKRFSGYFSIADCLNSLLDKWKDEDVAALRHLFNHMLGAGLIEIVTADADCES